MRRVNIVKPPMRNKSNDYNKIRYNAKQPEQCDSTTDPATWATFDVLHTQVFGQADIPLS